MMSRCDLAIRFDRDDRTYRAGDEIRGEVTVLANRDVKTTGLQIELGWATHGVGNVDQGTIETQREQHLHLSAGHQTTHPFRFTAPTRPLTYHGTFLNVELRVNARVEVSWAIDPKASEDLILVAGPGSRDAYMNEPPSFSAMASNSKAGKVAAWIFSPLILVLAVMLLAMVLLISPILLVVALVAFVRRRMAERRLGRVNLRIDAPEAADKKPGPADRLRSMRRNPSKITHAISPAQDFRIALNFMPPKAIELEATATLVGEERCRSGSGSNSTTHRTRVCEQKLVLTEKRQYQAGQPAQLEATFTPPEGAAYSFSSSDNDLEWSLEVRIDIPGPDWVETRKLRMVPA